MRWMKILYPFFCLGLLVLFHILYTGRYVPYGYINIISLPVAVTGYLYPHIFSLILIASSWVFFYPVSVFYYGIDSLNAVFAISVFNCLQAGFAVYKGIMKQWMMSRHSALKEKEDTRKKLSEELERLTRLENAIRDKEIATVGLYEITKKMSEDLRFDDIFNVLGDFIKENFTFRRCDFLILDTDGVKPRPGRRYCVFKTPGAGGDSGKVDYDRIVDFFAENPNRLYFSRAENRQFFQDMGLDNEETVTLAGIPLPGEKGMAAILLVENLPKADLGRFEILSMEFALEIRKVLLYEMVERLAITDSLTGLYVRRYFSERLDEELNRSRRHKFNFAFLMIDIDDFKKCNDTYGHLVGDVVLKDMARIIKESLREIDLLSRYGGEEFAVALPETDKTGAAIVAGRIRQKVEENVFKAYDESLKLTISAGFSGYPEDSDDAAGLIARADKALYAAKKSGKNVVYGYKR